MTQLYSVRLAIVYTDEVLVEADDLEEAIRIVEDPDYVLPRDSFQDVDPEIRFLSGEPYV